MSESFDIAIRGAEAVRFQPGPGATTYLEHGTSLDPHWSSSDVEGLPRRRVPKTIFESIVSTTTWRLVEGEAPERTDLDPMVGHLADERLVQVREVEPSGTRWPQYPPVVEGHWRSSKHESLLPTVSAELPKLAPEGWRELSIDCRATVRRMEIEARVTLPDGERRWWAPPPLVGQWLHRLRMREYNTATGVWSTASFHFTADGDARHRFDIEAKQEWVTPITFRDELENFADELRLLPRPTEAIFPWLYEAAAKVQRFGLAWTLSGRNLPSKRKEPIALIAPIFDGVDADGRPVAYRPVIDSVESVAILDYLRDAPRAITSRSFSVDELGDDDEPVVPRGYHTDGVWVWHGSVPYYLQHHDIPPTLALVDHIRQRRYTLPDQVPSLAMARAADLAMGRYDNEQRGRHAIDEALVTLREAMREFLISPRFVAIDEHTDEAWCMVRDDEWFVVYRAEGRERRLLVRFADPRDAAAYLIGQLQVNKGTLRYDLDEELPHWLSPHQTRSEEDPPLSDYAEVAVTLTHDLEIDRYGTPDGNTAYAADTPFEQRDLPPEHAEREYHRYVLPGSWRVATAVSPSGGRLYVLPEAFAAYLVMGEIEEMINPGLPPVTDALIAEAARTPDGWVPCVDPDLNPRFFPEGPPDVAVLGHYRVGPDGHLTGEQHLNVGYRPSPRRRGYPEPLSDFEAVLGYFAARWLSWLDLARAALDTQLLVQVDESGQPQVITNTTGVEPYLPCYSTPRYVPAGTRTTVATGRELLPVLAEATLVINLGGQPCAELPATSLDRVID
ncbi:hypothetical protein JOD54_004289 [Actinokineospora baliensis]|uniref:glycohydrolase toxin TNT-related protein n=1 Tax=Actinokineospora baliensis TaxID=547056 RepID=UPI00195B8775|nr:glycohydrolase toxin TNT-related protein [Actinokineospora baliensis]MBM7774085.1 hypothetical protein [Actinokineospora baliensis]